MGILAKRWPALASGLLISFAFAPFNAFLLVFVGLAPWLYSLREAKGAEGWRSGAWLGAVYFGFQMFWLIPFVGKWTGSIPLATIPWIISVALQIPYFMLLGHLVGGAYRRDLPWMIPIAWAGVESFRSYIPVLAFPHGLLATPLAILPPLIQLASIGTVFLVSAWIVLVNTALVEWASDAPIRSKIRYTLAALALMLFGVANQMQPYPATNLRVTLGQVGEDLAFGDPSTEPERIRAAVADLYARAVVQQTDLLVLPEGLAKAGDRIPPATPFRIPPPLPTIFGAQRGIQPIYQSSFAYDKGEWSYADKTRLVIFGEFVPFRDQLPFLKNFNLPAGDLVPGKSLKTLQVAGHRIAPLLCFEAMFPDIAARQTMMGPEALVVMSIDDWFVNTPMHDQLLAASAFRAVESGLPVIRVGSLGYTAAFDAKGAMISRAPLSQRFALRAEVPLPTNPQNKVWILFFPALCNLLCVGFLVWMHRVPVKAKPEK